MKVKIPLEIGFSNLSGSDAAAMLQQDAAVLSPLFKEARVVAEQQVPATPILFVYAHLNENGTIRGIDAFGIRQIVQATHSQIVVVALPNSQNSIRNASRLPGPKTADIVFTLDRKGAAFGRFFHALFELMRDGASMPEAWVRLAPQGPVAHKDQPAMILVADAGKLVFRAPDAV